MVKVDSMHYIYQQGLMKVRNNPHFELYIFELVDVNLFSPHDKDKSNKSILKIGFEDNDKFETIWHEQKGEDQNEAIYVLPASHS